MNSEIYPAFDEALIGKVSVIFRHTLADSHYLDDAPYAAETIEWFRRWAKRADEVEAGNAELDDLQTEARNLYDQLKDLQSEIEGMEIKDRLSYLKTGYSLLDKLLLLQERATNVKAYAKFQADVLQILDEIMTPEQRTIVMDRLKNLSH